MTNIFDIEFERPDDEVVLTKRRSSPAEGFIAGTFVIAFLAVAAPIYFHVVLKIVTWSWNLI